MAPVVHDAFEAFVRGGGGVYVWHADNNAFPDWPAYNDMIGLGWRGSTSVRRLPVGATDLHPHPPGEGTGIGHGEPVDTVVKRIGDHPIHAGTARGSG